MKAVILAGGYGTRLSEETHLRPKPMVEIGSRPLLWHIMKYYSSFGIEDFIICCGYKGYLIKEYFANYLLHSSDVTLDLKKGSMEIHQKHAEPWKVTLVDTGEFSQTGGRLKRVKPFIGQEPFCFTYGDGLSDLDLNQLIEFHKKSGLQATVTAVQMSGRFGSLDLEADRVMKFQEKPKEQGTWINGGFFIVEPGVLDRIQGDGVTWEGDVLPELASENQLAAFKHSGFWHCMDTMRDKKYLEQRWQSGQAEWKTWEQVPHEI